MTVHFVSARSGDRRLPTPNILDAVLDPNPEEAAETFEIMDGLTWDYGQAGDNAKAVIEHTVEIKRSERRASAAIIEAGKHLIAVKELLPHGAWLGWLETEFKMSDRTARRMMAVAEQFNGKLDTVSDLNVSILYMLAGDSVPEPARQEVIQRAQGGETVTKATAKAVIEEHRPAQERFYLSNDDVPAQLRAAGWTVRSKNIGAWWFENAANGNGIESAVIRSREQFQQMCQGLLERLEKKQRQAAKINTAPAVVVDAGTVEDAERPVTHTMLVAKHSIWKWLVGQCGAASFQQIVELAEALHYQEAQHPQWGAMYPRESHINDVFWGLEQCIDQAAANVPAFNTAPAAFAPMMNLAAAVLTWVRAQYSDYYGQIASLQYMLADPMEDADMQRMEPTLPTPYRSDDLVASMQWALDHLKKMDDEPEPEGAQTTNGALVVLNQGDTRHQQLLILRDKFQIFLDDTLETFGFLTGRHTDTFAAGREVRKLLAVAEREIALLEGREVAEE